MSGIIEAKWGDERESCAFTSVASLVKMVKKVDVLSSTPLHQNVDLITQFLIAWGRALYIANTDVLYPATCIHGSLYSWRSSRVGIMSTYIMGEQQVQSDQTNFIVKSNAIKTPSSSKNGEPSLPKYSGRIWITFPIYPEEHEFLRYFIKIQAHNSKWDALIWDRVI